MSTVDDNNKDDIPNICANCGKCEDSTKSLKACAACKMVKYCNRECQIDHRSQHKKTCKKRAAELHDEQLFKQPQHEDCPICFLRMPVLDTGRRYMSCCGKVICSGCHHAPVYDNEGNIVDGTCHFCRTPTPSSEEEAIERQKERVEVGDAIAMFSLGCYYNSGECGLPQDYDKALELWHRATNLGYTDAYYSIGNAYYSGRGVEVDKKKARQNWKLAAMGGNVTSRYNLGAFEEEAGNMDKALKHFMIAVESGCSESLEIMQKMYSYGHATKEDYTKALRAYQSYLAEIKSDQRDTAAAARDDYKYIE